jgi:hypothetical protein
VRGSAVFGAKPLLQSCRGAEVPTTSVTATTTTADIGTGADPPHPTADSGTANGGVSGMSRLQRADHLKAERRPAEPPPWQAPAFAPAPAPALAPAPAAPTSTTKARSCAEGLWRPIPPLTCAHDTSDCTRRQMVTAGGRMGGRKRGGRLGVQG